MRGPGPCVDGVAPEAVRFPAVHFEKLTFERTRLRPRPTGADDGEPPGAGVASSGPSRMVRWGIPILLAVGAAAASACGAGTVETPSDPELAKGQKVYNERCASCHGDKGQGGSGMKLGGGRLKQVFPNLQDQVKVINDGRKGTAMAAWKGILSPEEITAVAKYEREILPG